MTAMKNIFYCLCAFMLLSLSACNKYSNVTNVQLTGYAYVHDTLNSNLPLPMALQPVFVYKGTDTTGYILQGMTDTAGYFSLPYFSGQAGIVATRFTNNETEFTGRANIVTGNKAYVSATLQVYPVYLNGMAVIITDPFGGPVSNYPLRVYTSKAAAILDEQPYAFANISTALNGRYTKYNINAGTYYITAIDTVGGTTPMLIDSIIVKKGGPSFKTVKLKH
jgi:hypothetical protein